MTSFIIVSFIADTTLTINTGDVTYTNEQIESAIEVAITDLSGTPEDVSFSANSTARRRFLLRSGRNLLSSSDCGYSLTLSGGNYTSVSSLLTLFSDPTFQASFQVRNVYYYVSDLVLLALATGGFLSSSPQISYFGTSRSFFCLNRHTIFTYFLGLESAYES